MSHLFDLEIAKLESLGLCKEISNDESEIVAGGMFGPFFVAPPIGWFGIYPTPGITKPNENTKTTVKEGDGWVSYTIESHEKEEHTYTFP
ncbi:hypothetical protein QUB80_15430 [Chlorogloeopsis sp. ULAP01]|uniref:hypothetical protein n=1 Tax=Chlorogloeopsis sp. ULAP01 TaxID=3056483 RepID=UPI0025AAE67F|nr:hypothetical protein [Chlorogloeopsis sp. ULAP01]MDM9382093.1 hypothetical protein [Chlorogloeopsis sp. ULAP01]